MFDAVKNYLALANGVTEVTRQRAVSAAKALVASGEATAEQVGNLADDLLTTSRNNRDTVLALVRYEIDRALVRLGLATSEEISSLAQRLASVESTVREALGSLGTSRRSEAGDEAAPPLPTKRATKAARKAPAKRSPAKRSPAKRVAGSASTQPSPRAAAAPAKKAAARKAAPQKAAVKEAPAKKEPAKKAPARRTRASGGES